MNEHKWSLPQIPLCFPVLCIAQSSPDSQRPVTPLTLCPVFLHTLPQLIGSSRTRATLRAPYLTFLLRLFLRGISGVPQHYLCPSHSPRYTCLCLGFASWSDLPCSWDYPCFCTPEELFKDGKSIQKVSWGILVQEHSRSMSLHMQTQFALLHQSVHAIKDK